MKKKALFLLAILAVFSFSACSHNKTPISDNGTSELIVSAVSETTPGETAETGGDESASSFEPVTESPATVSKASEAPAPATEAPTERQTEVSQQTTAETSPTPQPSAPETPTAPAEATESMPESTTPPATSQPTESQPTESPTPSFDVSTYVSYAKDYGQSIGLTLDSTAISSWDTPTEANARCIYLERDLKDLLDWYKASGFTAFWVWAESEGSNQFLIYVGYA